MKPEFYIEIRNQNWEIFSEGIRHYQYKTPVQYLNDKSYFEYPVNSDERNNWATYYWESEYYNTVMDIVGNKWKDQELRNKVFKFIYENKPNGEGAITPLKDFEKYLLHQGFELISFDCMNAFAPGFNISADRIEGNKIYGPKSYSFSRVYCKDEELFCTGFGVSIWNFYFVKFNNGSHSDFYQIPIKEEEFELARNLQTKSLSKTLKEKEKRK